MPVPNVCLSSSATVLKIPSCTSPEIKTADSGKVFTSDENENIERVEAKDDIADRLDDDMDNEAFMHLAPHERFVIQQIGKMFFWTFK